MKNVLLAFFLTCLMACEEDEVQRSCLPPPCGTIDDEQFNISFVYEGELGAYESDSIVWTVGATSIELSLAGDTKGYSCWNQTELYPSVSLLNSINYVRDGQVFKIDIDGGRIQTNTIRVDLLLSGMESYKDWDEGCKDIINN